MKRDPETTPGDGGAPIAQSPIEQRRDERPTLEMGPPLVRVSWESVRARWDALGSTKKLRAKQLGVAAAIGVLGYGLYSASSADAPVETAPSASKLDMGAGLRGDSLEEKLRGDLKKVLDGQQMLGDRVTAIEEGKTPLGPHAAPIDGSDPEAGPLPPALAGLPSGMQPSSYPSAPEAADTLPPPMPPAAPPPPPVEKVVGAIGQATTPNVPKEGGGSPDSKKTYGPPRLQVEF